MQIVQWPDERLKQVSRPATGPCIQVVADMQAALASYPGLGISSVQVGHTVRIAIVRRGEEYITMFNPEITKLSPQTMIVAEGRLSLQGHGQMWVKRHKRARVRYCDVAGETHIIKGQGLLAQQLQHEIDHLDGMTILDRPTTH